VQPVAVHNGKNDKGKWESLVTLEDKHKCKVILSVNGKVSKQDKIHLETRLISLLKMIKPKPVDYSHVKREGLWKGI
jgi:exosome complex RNA-binding protein Rrp4